MLCVRLAVHVGSVRQTATIVNMTTERLRTGDKATVRFRFIKNPEYLKIGLRMVFREGRTKAVGTISKLFPHVSASAQNTRQQRAAKKAHDQHHHHHQLRPQNEPQKPSKRNRRNRNNPYPSAGGASGAGGAGKLSGVGAAPAAGATATTAAAATAAEERTNSVRIANNGAPSSVSSNGPSITPVEA